MFNKLFTALLAVLLVFGVAQISYADTYAFGGIGGNVQLLRDVENVTYDLRTDFGFSGGLATTLSDRWMVLTIYDYTVNTVKDGGVIFVNELLASTGYRLNASGRVGLWLLGGFEVTDGNVEDYGTFISVATGALVTYSISNTFTAFGGSHISVSDGYADAKLRLGVSLKLNGLFGSETP